MKTTIRAHAVDHESVPADPHQWSEQSKHSVAFYFRREYVDRPYKCWRCGAACTFSAQDQKYTFEVKKASVNQRRNLCAMCWSESHRLRTALSEHDVRWTAEKSDLRSDKEFLCEWLDLLTRWKQFAPYKLDVAKMNMLRRLLKLE
jgi:hypothetical protein